MPGTERGTSEIGTRIDLDPLSQRGTLHLGGYERKMEQKLYYISTLIYYVESSSMEQMVQFLRVEQ